MTAHEELVSGTAAGAKDAPDVQGAGTAGGGAASAAALSSTTPNSYEELEVRELAGRVTACKNRGFRFIQMCATTTDAGVELLYSFSDPDPRTRAITAFILQVEDGAHVPSISGDYPEAFVNENEAHDLFGVCFDGLGLDYEGKFYTIPVAYPMNPRAAACKKDADAGADTPAGAEANENSADKEAEDE